MKTALYARVSTTAGQTCENQLLELRRYVEARAWLAVEYVDEGVSGAKERRPALDQLVTDAKRRKFDVLVVWRLDRLGRSLRHLILLLEELTSLGVSFVSLGIDTGTPAGRLQLHLLAAIAQFERERIVERVRAGLRRVAFAGRMSTSARRSYESRKRLNGGTGKASVGEPKSESSRRTVRLPEFAIDALKRHRAAQKEDKLAAGKDWVETGLVFTTSKGTILDYANVRKDFKRLLRQSGLPDIGLHALRHTCATILMAQGAEGRHGDARA